MLKKYFTNYRVMKKYLFILSILFCLIACTSSQKATQTTAQTPVVVDDGKISFAFLQLNDVYEIAPLEGGKVGGLARVASLRSKLLQENPNTFTVMAGDFLNPSLLGTMKLNGKRIKGKQMVETMNALGVDLVTFGNHEFDLSKNELQQRLNESDFAWTSANVRQKLCGDTFPFHKVKNGIKEFATDTHILEAKDADGTTIKIGVFGVVIPSNPVSFAKYTDIYEQAKRAYNVLKNKVDVVIGLTHVEIGQDKKIAAMLPKVPLIMGGHEHNNMLIEVGNTKIAKADANAKTVYVHRINYNTKTKQVVLKSELVPVTKALGEDDKVKKIVEKWNTILLDKIKEIVDDPHAIIYDAKTPLDGRDTPTRSVQTNLGQLIAISMSYGFNDEVDCALVNGGSIRIDDQLSGPINSIDVFRVLPFGGGIVKTEITGNLLKQVLDYGKKSIGTGAYLQRYNAEYKDGWLIKGKPIDIQKTYKVAFTDFLLKGYDIPFLKKGNKEILNVYYPAKDELGNDIRKTVIAYIESK